MEPEQAVPAQLRAKDIDRRRIELVVMTHLHVDHASAISEFPHATFVVSGAEWESATDGGPRQGYTQRQFDHAFDYRLLDFDGPDAESFAGFGRSFDLFGDGSVRCVYTPGIRSATCPWSCGCAPARCWWRATRSTCERTSTRCTRPTEVPTTTSTRARCARSASTSRRPRTRW